MTDPKCSAERPCGGCGQCVWHEATAKDGYRDHGAAFQVIDAALARAREEGAAEMRERAALVPRFLMKPEHNRWSFTELKIALEHAIRALPLTPDEEEKRRG